MMEEHFMRGWVHSHDRLSADLDRGLKGLGARLRRLVKAVSPGRTPGEDSYFTRLVPARRAAAKPPRTRAAKPR